MADFFDALRPGTRVVVRYRITGDAGHTLSDALGEFDGVVLGGPVGPGDGVGPGGVAEDSGKDSDASAAGKAALAPGERGVRILTRRGAVLIPTAQVTHAKPVPPPPPRRRGGDHTASGTGTPPSGG